MICSQIMREKKAEGPPLTGQEKEEPTKKLGAGQWSGSKEKQDSAVPSWGPVTPSPERVACVGSHIQEEGRLVSLPCREGSEGERGLEKERWHLKNPMTDCFQLLQVGEAFWSRS